MKHQIQQFHNDEFGSMDILMIDGKPYFPATECAKALGYRNPHDAISKHCRYLAKREVPHPQSPGKTVEANFIPEGDLYRLIIRSKLPAAERFEKWVFDEVLPAIRKHGAYVTPDMLDEMIGSAEFTETLIGRLDEERKMNGALLELAEEMAPKVIYCDLILQSKSTVPVSLIAKDYGMTAAAFNGLLHGLGIQYRVAGTWLLYQKYAARGYTQTRTYQVSERTSVMHTYWTQRGRLFLYETLKAWGILPLMEREIYREKPVCPHLKYVFY
ncbi:MAG: phage antirepressor KilAC domain-containing protein [Peptococcaceae bacterium]|nr:phage antirepressor KilAC domain-containing protein [Peptococcaceae bacterium]